MGRDEGSSFLTGRRAAVEWGGVVPSLLLVEARLSPEL